MISTNVPVYIGCLACFGAQIRLVDGAIWKLRIVVFNDWNGTDPAPQVSLVKIVHQQTSKSSHNPRTPTEQVHSWLYASFQSIFGGRKSDHQEIIDREACVIWEKNQSIAKLWIEGDGVRTETWVFSRNLSFIRTPDVHTYITGIPRLAARQILVPCMISYFPERKQLQGCLRKLSFRQSEKARATVLAWPSDERNQPSNPIKFDNG